LNILKRMAKVKIVSVVLLEVLDVMSCVFGTSRRFLCIEVLFS